jgi:ATP-binding cassette subfamily F protein uup
MVFEAEGVSKAYGGAPVVRDLTLRVQRGDRIGLVGPNGAGKTTLLRMLLGDVTPDAGEVRRGANVQVAYYDQQREQLDPERTVFDTVGDGNDTVTVNGGSKHVHGYLRDFLFSPERARSPVKALSGGERNRLLLARLFTKPANVLVLDEPTNDLDLETLELLEAELVAWTGTLLIVSHDRRFLDNVVTSILVFEGEGRVEEYVGGYADWEQYRLAIGAPTSLAAGVAPKAAAPSAPATPSAPAAPVAPPAPAPAPAATSRKLSFKEQRELAALPGVIEALEAERGALRLRTTAPEFYKEPADAIRDALARLEAIDPELAAAYDRWNALEARA